MKVAICTPCHGMTQLMFTGSLAKMLIHVGSRIETEFFIGGSADLAATRERLADAALAWSADWILWLDSDQTFPPDTLDRLLASGKPVIGCNYPKRAPPHEPTALRQIGGQWHPVPTSAAKAGMIEQVDSMGLGVCLVRADVFRSIARPWFRFVEQGEDAHFFYQIRLAGFQLMVDHTLSLEIGHIGWQVFSFPRT